MLIFKLICTLLMFIFLNIWMLWFWALLIAIVVVWGGFLFIEGDIFD